jgi:hypothetical protein
MRFANKLQQWLETRNDLPDSSGTNIDVQIFDTAKID